MGPAQPYTSPYRFLTCSLYIPPHWDPNPAPHTPHPDPRERWRSLPTLSPRAAPPSLPHRGAAPTAPLPTWPLLAPQTLLAPPAPHTAPQNHTQTHRSLFGTPQRVPEHPKHNTDPLQPHRHPPPAPTASHRAAQNSPSAPQAPPQPHSDPPNPHSTSEPPQTHHFLTAPIAPHRAPPAPQSPPRPPSSPHSPHRAPPFPQSPHSTSQSLPSSPHILTAPPDPLHPLTAPIATHGAPPPLPHSPHSVSQSPPGPLQPLTAPMSPDPHLPLSGGSDGALRRLHTPTSASAGRRHGRRHLGSRHVRGVLAFRPARRRAIAPLLVQIPQRGANTSRNCPEELCNCPGPRADALPRGQTLWCNCPPWSKCPNSPANSPPSHPPPSIPCLGFPHSPPGVGGGVT